MKEMREVRKEDKSETGREMMKKTEKALHTYLQKSVKSRPRKCVSHFCLARCRSSFLPPSLPPSLLPLLLLLLLLLLTLLPPQPVALTRRR